MCKRRGRKCADGDVSSFTGVVPVCVAHILAAFDATAALAFTVLNVAHGVNVGVKYAFITSAPHRVGKESPESTCFFKKCTLLLHYVCWLAGLIFSCSTQLNSTCAYVVIVCVNNDSISINNTFSFVFLLLSHTQTRTRKRFGCRQQRNARPLTRNLSRVCTPPPLPLYRFAVSLLACCRRRQSGHIMYVRGCWFCRRARAQQLCSVKTTHNCQIFAVFCYVQLIIKIHARWHIRSMNITLIGSL